MDDAHHPATYRERIQSLIDETLERDIRELLIYTMRKHGRRASIYREPEDYPQEAILRTLDGRRRYRFDGVKTLMEHYQSVIDSLVSHDLEKARRTVALVGRDDGEEGTPRGGYDGSRIVAADRTEGDVIDRVDTEKRNAGLKPDERQYEELRGLGLCKSAKDFSREMHIPVSQVRNIEKRIARRKRRLNENQAI